MSTKLYVGNLSYQTSELDVQDLFTQHGTVSEVHMVMDRMSGRSRGFAFVTMSTPEEAQAAIEKLDGENVDGRNIVVNEARPKEDFGNRGGGGRRGGGGGGGGKFRGKPRRN